MSNPTARPEAEEAYLIWNRNRREWIDDTIGYTPDVQGAMRYTLKQATKVADGFRLIAVPLSQALESGPPVEAQETPEERTLREIAELPEPVPGEVWHHCDGGRVRVERTWHDGHDLIIEYRWFIYDSLHPQIETRTLRSWYGFERPGVRRFQRERPEPTYPCDTTPFHRAWDDAQTRAHENARAKGWHDSPREDGTMIALMHSELSEALEALRKGNPESRKIPGYSHVEEEMADVVIRIMDFAGLHGLDLGGAIEAKMAMNEGRSYRHGGKEF